ncbi:MATE family efflux transporter [Chondrinema litorale]|uniref:MATE family efflux transporter n=1 Tax=Chondrinema litorale TaxID=2994555 RepID=UPI0025438C57|nr:MATE family efflux transporter [Chondrinema litorale]UZR94135.1 MATE family efflux transporter [Chondrinema litorale]
MKIKINHKEQYSKTLLLAYPIILSQMGQMLTGIVDNMMVGRVGTTSLAASSFANGIFSNVMIFGMGFAIGLTPLIGKAIGRKDSSKAANLFRHSLMVNLILGVLLTSVLFIASNYMDKMGQPEQVVTEAIPYFLVISSSMLPLMIFFSFKQFTEGISVTKPAMVFTLLSNLLNVILNYILIYGKFGIEPMGLVGAGWATLISRIFQAIGLFAYVWFSKRFAAYNQKAHHHFVFRKETIKELVSIGIPIALQFTMEVAAFAFGTIMMGWVGKTELAAHQIALSLASLTFMTVSGLASATTVRVSNQYGEGNYKEMRLAAMTACYMVLIFMAFSALIFLTFNHLLPLAFISDPEVIKVAASLLILAGVFQLFDGVQVTMMGALRGLSDVKVPTYIALIAYWFIALPVAYIFSFKLGFNEAGIWIGFCSGLGIAAILLYIRFNHISKRMIKDQNIIVDESNNISYQSA